MSVFDEAKKYIGKSLIESYFPGGEWKGDEYWIPSPLRSDRNAGSFHIYEYQGAWCFKDFADDSASGDFIKLVSLVRNISPKEAAEDIIRSSGGVIPEPTKKKPPKAKPIIPIPEEARALLNKRVVSDYEKEKHGRVIAGWSYFTAAGEWCFSVAKYVDCPSKRAKEVVPYYFGSDNKWHEGQAYPDGRPLYNLVGFLSHPGWRVVLVEGEKCTDAGNKWAASVGAEIVFVSWSGGCEGTVKSDFSPLTEAVAAGLVTMWPDADKQNDKAGKLLPWAKQPGMKAALAIRNRLPGLKICDVEALADVKDGYDIADFLEEGSDPLQVIDGPLYVDPVEAPANKADEETGQFFRCLGWDEESYWFIREGKRIPQTIPRGSFNASRLQELAPLAFWGIMGMVTNEGGVRVPTAQDWLINLQDSVGRYDPDILRGAGVWLDNDDVIVNDGECIVTRSGERVPYQDWKSKYTYLSSAVRFCTLTGDEATTDEGFALAELITTQGFVRVSAALAVIGWVLIAPFGGILKWRPHIWISGKAGSGKSWIIENIVDEMLGRFKYAGTGKSSEASIRRELRTDARPVRLDEMEPKNKDSLRRIESILDLERNSSSDASGHMSICSADGGTINFMIHSCFCNASVRIPDMDAAADSRIIKCEMVVCSSEQMAEKMKRTAELMPRAMGDPSRYIRRMFRAMPRILSDIKALREGDALRKIGGQRDVDQWAPLFAAAYALISDDSITEAEGQYFISQYIDDIALLKTDSINDEDRVIEHILSAQVESDGKTRRTVAECLVRAEDKPGRAITETREWKELLGRFGIALCTHKGKTCIAIASRSDAILRWLKDTGYDSGYDAQLKRHSLCMTPRDSTPVRMGEIKVRARVFDWAMFKELYIGTEGAE
jgi:putative DNA primase/helicase